MTKHVPVLLEEVKEGLHLQKGMVVADVTLGGGGHTRMLLEAVSPEGKVVALDTDAEALRRFEARIVTDPLLQQASEEGRLVVVESNYSALASVLDRLKLGPVDALLADLGFSSDQIEEADRGFSFRDEGPLDMRLNQKSGITAAELLATQSEVELAQLLREYGDEEEAMRIAQAIVKKRGEAPLTTTGQLAALIELVYPKKKRARLKIHPATKTFQALRIAVNQEFAHLEQFLVQALQCLKKGGRFAVITFHSGEDKRVKEFFRAQATGCICPPTFPICRCNQVPVVRLITKKPVVASEQERLENPRARSAKLRIVEKV